MSTIKHGTRRCSCIRINMEHPLTPPTEQVAEAVKEATPNNAAEAKGQANEALGQAKGKASELQGEASKKAGQVQGEASKKAGEAEREINKKL